MSILSILLSQLALNYDRQASAPILHSVLFYSGSASGARSILSTIASSMITVAGVVFSMTLVTLSLASQQFGARTLRSLMRDRGNQASLGVFISTFLYCLLILREIRGSDQSQNDFVPQFSMLIALCMAIGSLIGLIYYIHHIAYVIQSPHVIAIAGDEMAKQAAAPASGDWRMDAGQIGFDFEDPEHALMVRSTKSGYVRRVDYQDLARLSGAENIVIKTHKNAGDFVLSDEVIMTIFIKQAGSQKLSPKILKRALESFNLGRQRTQEQDLRFATGQILSIALLALSPAINNPIQAIICIDHLAEGLSRFAAKPPRGDFLFNEKGKLAVVDHALTFDELFQLAFSEIRLNSAKQLKVSVALLRAFRQIYSVSDQAQPRLILEFEYDRVSQQIFRNFADEVSQLRLAPKLS